MRRLLALLAVLLLVLPGTAVAQETAEGRTVIADGHVDLGPRFAAGAWTIQIRDDTADPAVWRELDDVVLQVTDAARVTVPEGEEYAFLGAAGSRVWVLPQTQQAGVLWPGWNTQDPEVGATVRREVSWRLHGVQGPGTFVLFLTGNFGTPETIFDSDRSMPQETGIEVNTHVHGNWAFTAPGTYLLDIEMAASAVDGRKLSDRKTLRMHIGNGSPEVAFATTPTRSGRPVAEEADASLAAGSNTGWFIGGAAAIVVLAVVLLVLRRARRGNGDG